MARDSFDAVVIGSGPGGGATAWALAKSGLRVLVLEAGPTFDPYLDYRLLRPDWEVELFPHKPNSKGRYTHGPMQQLTKSRDSLRSWNHLTGRLNQTDQRSFFQYEHVRAVGGSSLAFSAEAHRLHPKSMKMHTRFGKAGDWPMDYQELEPYYAAAEKIIGVAGLSSGPERDRSGPFPLPPHKISYASTKMLKAMKAAGLTPEPAPMAILSRPYDGRPDCNYCAACNRGCMRTDKGSVDVTFIRKAKATGLCEVRPESQVVRIEAGPGDRIKRVIYVDPAGRQQKAEGKVTVVSCGAIETPRLLLVSQDSKYAPDGLCNESGVVGKNFMESIAWASSAIHPDPLGSHRGITSDLICWDLNAPDSVPGIIGGCRFTVATASANLLGPINYAKRVVGGFGLDHHQRMKDLFGRAITIASIGESLPNPRSFIELDREHSDALGIPLAKIHSYVDDMESDRMAFMAGKCREILEAMGVLKIFEEYGSYDYFNSSHVFGTCRMGADPGRSALNSRLQSHRWKNLFVVDASVFPSSGGGESPSLTIEALAIRTAGKIKELASRGEL